MNLVKTLKNKWLHKSFVLTAMMLLSAVCVMAQPPGGGFPGGREDYERL